MGDAPCFDEILGGVGGSLHAYLRSRDRRTLRQSQVWVEAEHAALGHLHGPFAMPLTRLFRLLDELYWETSSWTNGVRLVLDTPIGKVRREDIVAWDRASGVVTFAREGQPVRLPRLPRGARSAG